MTASPKTRRARLVELAQQRSKAKTQKIRTAQVPANLLRIAWPEAQRGQSEAHILDLAENWKDAACGFIKVCRLPDDTYHVVDGKHRTEAKQLHYDDISVLMDCEIVDANNAKEAAEIFTLANKRLVVNALTIFKNNVTAEVPAAVEINNLTMSLGFKVAHGQTGHNISAVQVLRNVYAGKNGKTVLLHVLTCVRDIWQFRHADATEGSILKGFAAFVEAFHPDIDYKRLIRVVKKEHDPVSLIGAGKSNRKGSVKNTAKGIKIELIDLYNNGLRSGRLEELRGGRKSATRPATLSI